MIQSVAFIGLGAMGYRMAAHLPKHFETVYVWNRTFAKAEEHAAEYGTQAVALEQAVQADIIFLLILLQFPEEPPARSADKFLHYESMLL